MTTEKFTVIWPRISTGVCDLARFITGSIELQEDCVQEAALRIDLENGDMTDEYYLSVASQAIRAAFPSVRGPPGRWSSTGSTARACARTNSSTGSSRSSALGSPPRERR